MELWRDFDTSGGIQKHPVHAERAPARPGEALGVPLTPRRILQKRFSQAVEDSRGRSRGLPITFRFLNLKGSRPYSAVFIGRAGKF